MSGAPRPRRILYNELNEDGTVGGSHRCLYDLVLHLDRRRYDPVVVFYQENPYVERLCELGARVLTWEKERRRERLPGGRFRRPRLALRGVEAIGRRARLILRERIDLVHLNNSPLHTADDWLPAARLTRRPVISHCRAELPPGRYARQTWLARRFDRVIAISRTVEDSLRQAGVPAPRIAQVYDGIDLEALRARVVTPAAEVRRALAVADEAFLVLMVGHLRSWKGQHVLLEAARGMQESERARLAIVFAGAVDPAERAYAEGLRAQLSGGLLSRVRFLGARDDVPDLMHAADVVVHASVVPEPLGLVVLEGMALGKPVLASRLGGPSETVTQGTGLLFDPAHPQELAAQLSRLLHDPALRGALGAAGRERARSFAIENNVRAIQGIYEDLLP